MSNRTLLATLILFSACKSSPEPMHAPAERPPLDDGKGGIAAADRLPIYGQVIERCPVADKPLRDKVVKLQEQEIKTDHAGAFNLTTKRETAQLTLSVDQKEVPLSANPEGDYFVSVVLPCSDPGSAQGEIVAEVRTLGPNEIPRKEPPLTPKNWPNEGPLQKPDPVGD